MTINHEKSLRENIRLHYKSIYPKWENGGIAENIAFELGMKAQNAGRRCREMVSGKLSNGQTCPIVLEREERKSHTGVKSVWYQYIPTEHELLSWNMQKMIELEDAEKENRTSKTTGQSGQPTDSLPLQETLQMSIMRDAIPSCPSLFQEIRKQSA